MNAEFLLGLLIGGFLSGLFFFVIGVALGYQTAFGSFIKQGFAVMLKDKLQQSGVGEVVCLEMYVSVISDDDGGDGDCCDDPCPFDSRILNN
jgi:hypothetical protein